MKRKEKVTAYDRVKLARDAKRPHITDFIKALCRDVEELHGDRLVNDDQGLVGGFATIDGVKALVLGHHKGATVEENMTANFGMANPDGYRKAMRLAKLAEKFHLPIVTFVDTPGAYPGDTAEARGQAEAIAKSLEFFSLLKTPIVVVVTGEGVLQVFDLNGRMLASRELHGVQTTVGLPEVANGVYVLRLTEGKQSRVQKMVISK